MNLTTKATTLSIKATEDATRTFTGYASTFNGIDSYGDSIAPGAFADTIARHSAEGTRVPILYGHSHNLADNIGEVVEMTEDDHGLLVRAQLDDTDNGQKVYNLIKGRRLSGLSIGFYPNSIGTGVVEGKSVNVIESADLVEISVVLTPADANARVTSVKAAGYNPDAVMSSHDVDEILKSAHAGDVGTMNDTLDRQLDMLKSRRAADAYREHLLTKGTYDYRVYGTVATEAEREAIEKAAVMEIMTKARNAGRGLTAAELTQIDAIRSFSARRADAERKAANLRALGQFQLSADHEKEINMKPATHLPVSKSARSDLATRTADTLHEKGLAAGTSAVFEIPVVDPEILAEPRPANTLLELLPAPPVANGPAFSYMRQSRRELNADVVPTGELKPESHLGFTRVDDTLDVVAHVAKGIDEYLVEDYPALQSFLANEMTVGVLEKVDALTVETLYGADGHVLQEFTTDPFSTIRRGIATLQSLGLHAGAIILHPMTWADMETAKATGTGEFVFKGAPVNQEQQTLWGVPVVTSLRVPEGNGLVLDLTAAEIRHDATFKFGFFFTGEDVERNQLTVRAESRFKPIVKRNLGIVEALLTETATPNNPVTEP